MLLLNSTQCKLAAGIVAANLAAFSTTIQAQSSQDSARSVQIEEMVVTASKREQSLQDSSMSISAMSEKTLQNMGASSFSDYFRNIPSLSINDRGPGRSNIIIRGVSVDAQDGQIPTTAIYVDETAITGQFSNTDLRVFDIERVEVLRGPQGTLYGASSLGGALRYITKKPDVSEFEGYINSQFQQTKGGSDGHQVDGAVNLPLIDDVLAVRLSAYTEETGGFIDSFGSFDNYRNNPNMAPVRENLGGAKTDGGRLNILWNATDDLSVKVGYVKQDSEGTGQPDVETVLSTNQFTAPNFRDPSSTTPVPANLQTGLSDLATFTVGDDSLKDEIEIKTLNVAYDYESLGTFSYSYSDLLHKYRFGDTSNDNNPFLDQGLTRGGFINSKVTNKIHELRWVTPAENDLRGVLGFYMDDSKNITRVADTASNQWLQQRSPANTQIVDVLLAAGLQPGEFFLLERDAGVKQKALYGELTYDFTEQWQITAGVRRAEWEQSGNKDSFIFGDLFFDDGDFAGFTPAQARASTDHILNTNPTSSKDDNTIGKLSLSFRPTEDTLFFGLYSEGFRLVERGVNKFNESRCALGGADAVPGVTVPGLTPFADQKSDALENIEFGVKSSFMDGRINANAGVYQIDWTDIQFEGELPNGCGGYLANGDARIRGFEFEVIAAITENLQVTTTGAFTDGEVTRVPQVELNDGTRLPLSTVDVLGANVGTKMAGTPRQQFSVNLDYDMPSLVAGFDGGLNVNYAYTSAVTNNLNEQNVPGLRGSQLKADDISLVNLGFSLRKDNLSGNLFINNVFNKVQSTFKTINVDGTRISNSPTRPRTIGVGIRYDFQ